jgi:hypothetical protein
MTNGLAEVVEATGNQHDAVSKVGFGVAKALFDDAYALHSRQDVLDCHWIWLTTRLCSRSWALRSLPGFFLIGYW